MLTRTFVIADIRGYSTFTRERGDETAARLATRFAELARDAVEARGGRVIELRGDEALAVFESAPQAVRAALEFQEACREATSEDPELPLPVGIGVDCGEAIPVEDGFRGVALNMAARLCSKAAAGQVLVTTQLAEAAGAPVEVVFESRGAVELKGFDRPVELLEAQSTHDAVEAHPPAAAPEALPPELDDATPLADRERELRWLRGTWRQVARGRGRVLFLSGPAGIGKTRLAAELAAHVQAAGGALHHGGSGGAGGAQMLAAIAEAQAAQVPALYVLDELDLYEDAIAALAATLEAIGSRPVLLVGLVRDVDGQPQLTGLIERVDVRGDGHRRLGPLDLDGVNEIARAYVDDVEGLPAESILRSSRGVPGRVHELIGEWARDEARRRLTAAAEWLAEGKSRQAAGLEFASTAIALKLGRIYGEAAPEALDGACPYKGLAAFGEADAAYFYGRERLVGELAARTVGMGLLGVVGPSGSGKSSVVLAGLLPSLAAGLLPGSERWGHAILRPGEHPLAALEGALASCDRGTRLVLVVDQFEELFTTTTDEAERSAFIARLVELAADPERCVVVATIRADHTGHCAPYPELAELLAANLVLVGPMQPDELRRAIDLPARRAGLRVESALGDALVAEVRDEPGGLPLLSTALVELWRDRDGRWLRLESAERSGGVRGAVARLAEESYEQLSTPEREAAKPILLRLVGEGEGEAAVRRRAPVAEFDIDRNGTAAAVLSRFTEDRLLTRDDGMIEIAHEALIREWPRLRGWLEEDATGRQLRSHLTQSAKQWSEHGGDAADLYRGARLSATLDWAAGHDRELNELERGFLAESRQAGERDAERQRRANRRLRGLLIGTAVFLVVALVAGAVALVQRGRARDAQDTAEAQALRSDAERLGTLSGTEDNLVRSFLLAVTAVELMDIPETRGDLLARLQETPGVFRTLRPSAVTSTALGVSPDGKLFASGDVAGAVSFHDLRTWKRSGKRVQLGEPVSQDGLAFAPGGDVLAVATAQAGLATVYLIDEESRSSRRLGSWPSAPANAGPLRFTSLAFTADGRRIAVAVATASPTSPVPLGQRLLLLDARSGRVIWEREYPLRLGQNEAQLAFTRQGLLVTSAQQGETILWDPRTGRIRRRFPVGGPFGLSPDGRLAAIARNNANPAVPRSSLAVLDLRSGRVRALQGLGARAWITQVRFRPDGASIVGASFEGAVRVWDLASGSIAQTFPGGFGLALDPSGRTALSAVSGAGVLALDLAGSQRLGRQFSWRSPSNGCGTAPCFVINPRGGQMAYALADGNVALVDLRTRGVTARLPAGDGVQTDALAFFADGQTLATGGVDGRVKLWDLGTREVTDTLRFPDRVWWVAVSPDGKLLGVQTKADESADSRVSVREVETGRELYSHAVRYGQGGLEFSPDGRKLAALGCCEPESSIVVWDARSGRELFTPQPGGSATSIAFSPDGRLGAGTDSGQVVLFDSRDGTRLGAPIQLATATLNPIAFSPDGRLLMASADEPAASLLDVGSRRRLGDTFPIEQGSIPLGRFTPGGVLVIDNVTNTAQWPTDLASWRRYACQVAGRDLSRAEWQELLPDRSYRSVCTP